MLVYFTGFSGEAFAFYLIVTSLDGFIETNQIFRESGLQSIYITSNSNSGQVRAIGLA